MDRERYYVSVQSKTIMNHQGDDAYEFEIDASAEEVQMLQDLFVSLDEFDELTYYRSHYPGVAYHHDSENDGYDYYLKEIYKVVQQLGTEETRKHVASMNLQMGSEVE